MKRYWKVLKSNVAVNIFFVLLAVISAATGYPKAAIPLLLVPFAAAGVEWSKQEKN